MFVTMISSINLTLLYLSLSVSGAQNISSLNNTSSNVSAPTSTEYFDLKNRVNLQVNNCSKKWPKIELFLPIYLSEGNDPRNSEWLNIFLRGFLLFWPVKASNTSIRLLLDAELIGSPLVVMHITNPIASLKSTLGDAFPNIFISYNDPKENVYKTGHDRQQYLMFLADNFTDAEYVGFMDTDALFHSYVDVDDLFLNDKPVIHGTREYIPNKKEWKHFWPAHSWLAIGKEEPLNCMANFPVLLKRSSLLQIREHIINRFNVKDWDHAFPVFGYWKEHYSQFNIMCTYLFWFKQDEYTWRVEDVDPKWDGHNPPPAYGQWSEKWSFTPEMLTHTLYLAEHLAKYHIYTSYDSINDVLKAIFTSSLCFKQPNSTFLLLPNASSLSHDVIFTYDNGSRCNTTKEPFYRQMHRFGELDVTTERSEFNITAARELHRKRRERIKDCSHTYIFI